MSDHEKLAFWMLGKSQELSLRVMEYEIPSPVVLGLHQVSVHLNYRGREWSGWGADFNRQVALTKAFAEGLERCVMAFNDLENSNGVAAHFSEDAAKENALGELNERDQFICHFILERPFEHFVVDPSSGSVLSGLQKWCGERSISIETFRLGRSGAAIVADGRQSINPFGLIFGTAMKRCLWDSLESAGVEISRSISYLESKKWSTGSITLEQFNELEDPDFTDHGRLALNLDYTQKISHLVSCRAETSSLMEILDESKMKFERLSVDPSWSDCPLQFFRATHPDAQTLFCGFPEEEKVNLERLSKVAGVRLGLDDLNPLPHPFA